MARCSKIHRARERDRDTSDITISSSAHDEVIDITKDVAALAAKMSDGVCNLFVQHTTCASRCFASSSRRPPRTSTTRPKHVRAHVLSALVGPSVSVPVSNGRLGLGQFQRIALVEFEGPRQRTIEVILALAAD